MAQIIVKEVEEKGTWESFLIEHPEANFLQSWSWGEFHQLFGNKINRVGFYDGEKLLGVMLSVVEDAKRGRYLTVPGGPIIDWENSDLTKAFVEEVKRFAGDNNCVFVRVRPQLELNDFSKNLFSKLGFINAPIHLHAELTLQLDITQSEDELLAQMRKATRYEIKKATNQGVKVTTSADLSLIREFYDMQMETAKRQKFVPFPFKFLADQFKVFSENNQALLFRAEFEGKLLAEALIIFYGTEAVYHYGASTDLGRQYPGAYLIQWEAIKEAKKRGLARYNFWGIAPEENKDHRFYGLSIFKRGFGGKEVHYLNAQDLVINKGRYLINSAIEKIRKKVRNV